jgi:fructose-1,6-bisphosphatase I/sedoheptulose-1,7-bisphosphatase
MLHGRTTLSKFLIEQLRGDAARDNDLAALLIDIAAAVKAIAAMVSKGALGGQPENLDTLTNQLMLGHCDWGGLVAGMVSEQLEQPYAIPSSYPRGNYLLAFDPLDGAANIDVNVPVGTIFSVLRHAGGVAPATSSYLQSGERQLAAGYAIYGPSTLLVLTVGRGTHGFTLDREVGNFVLTHPDLMIPADTSHFAINVSNERFWEPPVQRYMSECKAGRSGIRERDFKMRWIASMVAEVHRILLRGGVFVYPRDCKEPDRVGRLHLLYEASPLAFLVEQAGGAASTGRERLLEVAPRDIHQRVPGILGSRNEVERIERYHRDYDTGADQPFVSPLFNERSLYRSEAI